MTQDKTPPNPPNSDSTDPQLIKLWLEVDELRKNLQSKNEWKEKLSRYLPLATALLAIITFLYGIHQFDSETEREFKKPFWEKRLALYLEATKVTATLASFIRAKDGDSRKESDAARIRFWQLYYGDMAVVEDPEVSKSMVDFGKCLRDYEYKSCDQTKLMDLSLKLAQQCRDSVGRSWQEHLGPVKRE